MAEFFAQAALLPALLIGALLSLAVEQLLTPRPALKRPLGSWLLHAGVWLLAFAFEMSLFHRPLFAATFVLAFLLFLVLVSNAKFGALREPFIFSDFEYFTDTLRHPRLYIPFLGWWRAALALAGFIAAVWVGLAFETPMTQAMTVANFYLGVGVIMLVAAMLMVLGARLTPQVDFKPAADLQRLGFIACLWRYMVAEWKAVDRAAFSSPFGDRALPAAKPHIVVVQSESFFDARRLFAGIDRSVLQNWDQLQAESVRHGRVQVAAWGANTVRTEFSFLSGFASESLGVHQFNPYRKFARAGIATLASHLRAQGYRTICVHPYPASFYQRHIVFPLMGFDAFIDIEQFNVAEKSGPYIGDVAVAEKITALLDDAKQPLFIFAITMENHGPLHWETLSATERNQFFTGAAPAACDDLVVYLRHLANADRMVGMLREKMAALPAPAWLCFYGDHVPIMAGVYAQLGEPDGKTDYAIWSNRARGAAAEARETSIAALADTLLQAIETAQQMKS